MLTVVRCVALLLVLRFTSGSLHENDGQSIMSAQQEDPHSSGDSQTQHVQTDLEDDENSPMVHIQPNDYRSWALEERTKLQAEGEEVVLMSELGSLIPRNPDEPVCDYAKRYSDTMNAMVQRGVAILNDQTTADVVPGWFFVGEHEFNVGPDSGITKKEYREFEEWLGGGDDEDQAEKYSTLPEEFKTFEVAPGTLKSREEDPARDQ